MSIINGVTVTDDNKFMPVPAVIRSGQMVNGLYQTIGDFVRTQYTLNYQWDTLPPATVAALLLALDFNNYPTFPVTIPTIGGNYTSIFQVTVPLQAAKLVYSVQRGCIIWTDITLTLLEV